MADQRFTIEWDDAELQARLTHALERIDNPEQLLENIGARLEQAIFERFSTKLDPNGAPWAALSANTPLVYEKINKKPLGGSLLLRSGLMRASLSHTVGPDFVEVGLGESYAAFHELGTRKMPRRGMVFGNPESGTLGASDSALVEAEIDRFLVDLL